MFTFFGALRAHRGAQGSIVRALILAIAVSSFTAVRVPNARADTSIDPSFLPFNPLSKEELRASPRKTFARWHVEPISVDNQPPDNDFYARNLMDPSGYKGEFAAWGGMARHRPLPRAPIAAPAPEWKIADMAWEIEQAIGMGLDGFAFSVYQLPPKDGWQKLLNMLEAARRVDEGFRVMIYLDYPSLSNANPPVEQLADAIASIANHPSLFRVDDGRLVVTAGSASRFGSAYNAELIAALASRGVPIFFVAVEHQWSDLYSFAGIAGGYGRYGAETPASAPNWASSVATAHADGKIYMATAAPQFFRPRRGYYTEAQNTELLRQTWKIAIESKPDWLMLRNWNDYAEGNQVSPATGTQWAIYDLCTFYNTWYKTGVQPPIVREVLYYAHRIHATTTMPSAQEQLILPRGSNPEGARDNIELLAFLTKYGTLRITVGGKTTALPVVRGITSFKVPLANGIPSFSLSRYGKVVTQFTSAFEIRDRVERQDLLYRAGSSTRPVVDMVANPPLAQ